MLVGWKRIGLAALLAAHIGLAPAGSSAQTATPTQGGAIQYFSSQPCRTSPHCTETGPGTSPVRPWPTPSDHPARPTAPDATPEDPTTPDRPDRTDTPAPPDPDAPMPPDTPDTPDRPDTPDTPSPITPPDTTGDLAAEAPQTPQFALSTPQAGLGSPDVAFGGAPGMIGDFFGAGTGEMSLPLIIGRGILHADSVNGMRTQFGINDFHLIDESLSPVGFQDGDGASSAFFILPGHLPGQQSLPRQPNGDPIQPASVSGLQGVELEQYGFPPGSDEAFFFTATQTPDRVTVEDQESDDVFPNAPVYVITRGEGDQPVIIIPTGNPSTGGVIVGRQKTAENTSPIPRDRVFFNYNYFNNTPLFPGGVDVNRFSPGFEKTFLDGNASLEVRVPFATTLDNDITLDGATDTENLEFGNLYLALKGLLYQTETYAFSSGLAMTLPTGDDTRVTMANGTPLVRINNESVHLMPFLGAIAAPTDRLFAQGFLQFDFDTNGNTVDMNLFGNGLRRGGVANDATYMYLDAGLGYWLYRNNTGSSLITGIAPTVELHYNRSLQSADTIRRGLFQVGSTQDDVQILNALVGGTVQLGQSTTLTAAYVTPIGNSSDHVFDGEARVSLNWYFGRTAADMRRLSPLSTPPLP